VHISAHATATQLGDLAEAAALRTVFGTRLGDIPVTALKSSLGHTLGASGAVGTALTAMSIHDGLIPPTLNLDNLDPRTPLSIVTGAPASLAREGVSLVNSFGFGGHNTVIALSAE
jgi:3-oxoacyl-[acyl-carrier-protein] synthase II